MVNATGSPDCQEGRSQLAGSSPALPTTPAWYGKTYPYTPPLTLKQRLEAVWNDPRIGNPNRFLHWHESERGNVFITFGRLNLYYGVGRLPSFRKPRNILAWPSRRKAPLTNSYRTAWIASNNIGEDGLCQHSMN